ncbi:ABC transporter family substrate-binding protein [Georgenia sp. SYP-B2076]|uniref:ABC transporter family substrate-binding protein n=1 Tax=Georgenia sp. SYP-B2076 TaxID=2495881 RepID=UPI000F8F618D|nr:ABC transporter family substrate-binding protein [Georgenia sp. SYP-B2076]
MRRTAAAVSVLSGIALLLAACTSGTPEEPTPSASTSEGGGGEAATSGAKADLGNIKTADGDIYFSTGQDEWTGYNDYTADTYSTYNSVINGQIRPGGFNYKGTDGKLYPNPEFGTYKAVSGLEGDAPLVVEYTINDKAVWSDGSPIDYADMLLEWVAQNPTWLSPDPQHPVFNHVSAQYPQDVPDGPKGKVGGKTFTVTYARKNPDWELMVGGYILPAHVVAKQIGITEDALTQAILNKEVDVVTRAAKFWNGWISPNPGQLPDPAIAPSGGPYQLKPGGWEAGQSLTLEANPKYWGTPAATDRLTFRFLAADAHVQALQNGDLNVIEPQATVDTLAQLRALGSAVKVETGAKLTWEHLDYNFKNGVFSDAEGGLALRQAFAMCVPRQQIVDNLIKPINKDSVVMNAREYFPFQDHYDDVVAAAYDGRYDKVDIAGAKAKIAESGIAGPIDVRIGYSAPNPRRTSEVDIIKSSCDQAGFNVIDVGSADFFSNALPAGDYEVSLYAWSGSGQIASGQNIYTTNAPQNYGGYSDKEVDDAWATLASSLDPAVHLEQKKKIEKRLWDTLYGIPLFAHPGTIAYSADLKNVRFTAVQTGVSWNAEQWQRAE